MHAKLKVMFCQVPLMLQHSHFNCAKSKIYRTYLDIKQAFDNLGLNTFEIGCVSL